LRAADDPGLFLLVASVDVYGCVRERVNGKSSSDLVTLGGRLRAGGLFSAELCSCISLIGPVLTQVYLVLDEVPPVLHLRRQLAHAFTEVDLQIVLVQALVEAASLRVLVVALSVPDSILVLVGHSEVTVIGHEYVLV